MQELTSSAQTIANPNLLSERAYAALRDRLVTLEIPPGAPIDEEAPTRELGVGRTPVREAVRRLVLDQNTGAMGTIPGEAPRNNCLLPAALVYHPVSNPDGTRCGDADLAASIWGTTWGIAPGSTLL